MKRKLVRIDSCTGNYAEVDVTRLQREASALLDYIKGNIDPKSDEFRIWKLVVPLCQDVLDDHMKLPFPYTDLPLKYEVREGLLPDDFYRLYAEFKLTVSGVAREMLDKVEVNGVAHMYADFED